MTNLPYLNFIPLCGLLPQPAPSLPIALLETPINMINPRISHQNAIHTGLIVLVFEINRVEVLENLPALLGLAELVRGQAKQVFQTEVCAG